MVASRGVGGYTVNNLSRIVVALQLCAGGDDSLAIEHHELSSLDASEGLRLPRAPSKCLTNKP